MVRRFVQLVFNYDFRRQWAYTYLALSRFQVKANDLSAAVESAQQGIKIDEALVASSPTNVSARNTLALCIDNWVTHCRAGREGQQATMERREGCVPKGARHLSRDEDERHAQWRGRQQA